MGAKSSRSAMKSGLGALPQKGETGTFSTLLNTMKMLLLGMGVMLEFDPCMTLHSKKVTEPAGPFGATTPP